MPRLIGILNRKFRSAIIRARRSLISQRFGFSPDFIYKGDFFNDGGFLNTPRAAKWIAEYCRQNLSITNVLDIGCGRGDYLAAFSAIGIAAVGCDGASEGVRRAPNGALAFVHDLRRPLVLNRTFDLVLCIEVAEHLPKKYGDVLIQSIAQNAKNVILFSAAPPGCTGADHINCQTLSYWEEIFVRHGCTLDEGSTGKLREFAETNNLPAWWQEWSYVFRKEDVALRDYP